MSAVKTTGEFVELVKRMRMYQIEVYDNKNAFIRPMAGKYENLVDKAIKEREQRQIQGVRK